jgi:hypothetical protein
MTDGTAGNDARGDGATTTRASGRGRHWTVRALLTLGTVLAVLSILAVWANRQLLSANNWSETSTQMLADPPIQTQVSAYVVDQVYSNVDVAAELRSGLPPRLAPLAGPAAGGLRNLAEQMTQRVLARPRIQDAWKAANYVTAQQLIRIVKGQSKLVKATGNAVILDLRPVVLEVAGRLGIPDSLVSKIPPEAGKIRIMNGDQVSTLQKSAKALNALATLIPILALGSLGLAVLVARDRRRRTLLWAGISLVIAGGVALVARGLIGQHVVNTLATTESLKPAADAAWSIGTRMLVDVAQATIIGGIPLILAALLAGPTAAAIGLRREVAPWMRDRPGIVYGVVALLLLLIVAWGPIPATRKVIPVLVMTALVVLGVEMLRRQTAREFPDATADASRAVIVTGARKVRESFSGRPGDGGAEPAPDRTAQLERLADLRDRGVLSDREFAAEKRALLAH